MRCLIHVFIVALSAICRPYHLARVDEQNVLILSALSHRPSPLRSMSILWGFYVLSILGLNFRLHLSELFALGQAVCYTMAMIPLIIVNNHILALREVEASYAMLAQT